MKDNASGQQEKREELCKGGRSLGKLPDQFAILPMILQGRNSVTNEIVKP